MKLAEFLCKECIAVYKSAEDKKSVLKLVASQAVRHPSVKNIDEEYVYNGLMDREKLDTTGFGQGIAIPHFVSDRIQDFIVGILVIQNGADFKALDGKPCYLYPYIIAPLSKRNQHLGILSSIARFFKDTENVSGILKASSADEIFDFIQKKRPKEEDVRINYEHHLITVMVQLEEKFEEILDIVNETDNCYVSIVEARNARHYLYQMPLFASLWSSEEKDFNRIVFCMVRKTDTNRMIQKMNSIIDQLEDKAGILMFVQDLFYSNGALQI